MSLCKSGWVQPVRGVGLVIGICLAVLGFLAVVLLILLAYGDFQRSRQPRVSVKISVSTAAYGLLYRGHTFDANVYDVPVDKGPMAVNQVFMRASERFSQQCENSVVLQSLLKSRDDRKNDSDAECASSGNCWRWSITVNGRPIGLHDERSFNAADVVEARLAPLGQ